MAFVKEIKSPVLAYCTSGTRSAAIWALGQIGKMPKEEILKTTLKSGYNLEGLL
jgi:sulfide:quinone oxidoreductase